MATSILRFSSLIFVLALAVSCSSTNEDGSPKKKQRILPPSSGTHSELLLVMTDEMWLGSTGEAFREIFLAEQEGLPQPESYFDIDRVEPGEVNGLLKKTKSIIWVELSDTSFVKMQKDLWSRPQRLVRITAPTKEEVITTMRASAEQIVSAYKEHDMGVIQGRLRKSAYAYTHENLKKMGITNMLLHKGFDPTLDKEDLKIFATKTVRTVQYIVVSERPMSEGMVSVDDVISHRDSIGKHFFEGTRDGSYMSTELLIPPTISNTEISGMFALETRGLWKMNGDFMGGPFLSYTIYDEKNDRILTIESLVYGPTAKKRNVVLELEATMRSIKL